jgi:hypothetical protein
VKGECRRLCADDRRLSLCMLDVIGGERHTQTQIQGDSIPAAIHMFNLKSKRKKSLVTCVSKVTHCVLRFIYDFLMAKVCLFVIYYYNTSLNILFSTIFTHNRIKRNVFGTAETQYITVMSKNNSSFARGAALGRKSYTDVIYCVPQKCS